ncbi:MAG TPA: ROK family protein [Solirubrobacteraceae bacterium]|nr:ROK family protein [Solirubrobacteraceae bacterium]
MPGLAHQQEAFIGVDLGGTKVAVGTLIGGRIEGISEEATDRSGQEQLIAQIARLVDGQLRSVRIAAAAVRALGIGIPSVVEFASGRVRSSVNIPLADLPLRSVLEARLASLPTYVDNDANCAALAEAHDERGELAAASLVMVTVGTGVGGGIVIDGQPYRGASGAAGELGHMIVGLDLSDRVVASPGFPRDGSLESLASGRALAALASACGYGDGPQLVAAAQAGEQRAREALSRFGERLGVGVANVINIFDPEVVAIGGGVSSAGELLIEPLRRAASRFVLEGVGTKTQVRIARSGPLAGVRGAALMARAAVAG